MTRRSLVLLTCLALVLVGVSDARILNVSCEETVIHGDNITVKIQSDKANYNHIWVILSTGMKLYVKRVVTMRAVLLQ